jgi:hypothetical protein
MNCTDCQDKFTDILDDDAPGDMTTSFKAHLASCPSCASAFNGFKKTVQTLQGLPEQPVPADFLIGINEKLDTGTFARLKNWFSFLGQHKLTASATVATLIVGVISATVLQTTPNLPEQQLAKNETTYIQSITTQKENSVTEKNYYPGIPYLASKPVKQQTNKPVVQFASANFTKNSNGYYEIQNPRGSPQKYDSTYTNLNTTIYSKPDFHIIIHPASASQQQILTRRIASNTKWKTRLQNRTLFVTLTEQQLPEFQDIFPPAAPPHKKLDFTPLTSKTEQDLYTIAISFD